MFRKRPTAVAAATSCIKPFASFITPFVSQLKAKLCNDDEFATVYPVDSISQDILSQIYDVI